MMRFDRQTVENLLKSGSFFWLDLPHPSQGDFSVPREVFEFHPLAPKTRNSSTSERRSDSYDDFLFIVLYGAGADDSI